MILFGIEKTYSTVNRLRNDSLKEGPIRIVIVSTRVFLMFLNILYHTITRQGYGLLKGYLLYTDFLLEGT